MKNIKLFEKLFKNNKNIEKNIFPEENYLSPSYINTENPKYLEIDNTYYSGLIVVNYAREHNEIILKSLIDLDIDMNISIFYEKQNAYKILRNLTYHIGNVSADLKEISENREDIEIAQNTYNDAKYIRKEMQINSQDLYYLYIYINIFSKDKKELEYSLNKVEGILQTKGIFTRRANFRQEQLFLTTIPTMQNLPDI